MSWQYLQQPRYWLLAIAFTLITLHLGLLSQGDDSNLAGMSYLCWLAIASLVWEKRDDLKLESDPLSTFLGASTIVLVLLRSLSPAGYHLRICPFLSLVGLCLLASGWQRLHHYWRELLIISLLILAAIIALFLKSINLPTMTAQFSSFLLWILRFDVSREGVLLILPGGRVEVYGACSGIESIIQIFSIAVMFLLTMVWRRWKGIICIVVAVALGFIVNAARVALMAWLVNSSQMEAFHYWHGGDGSLIFSGITVFLFAAFYWFILLRNQSLEAGGN